LFGENCNYELKNLHPDTQRVFSGVSNAHPTFNNTTISLSLKTNITILKKPHITLPPISLTLKPEQLYRPQNLYVFILNQYHGVMQYNWANPSIRPHRHMRQDG
jgi:hypothetical protein